MKDKDVKSLLINTVHDSIVIDVHPDERDDVLNIMSRELCLQLQEIAQDNFLTV